MCGINAIVSFENKTEKNFLINKKTILKMNNALKKRGPDSSGIFISDKKNVFLGNVRLAITDVENAFQPIVKIVDGVKYVIIFNGQIYNFKEIAQELKEFKFNKNSDTEVLLFSYIKWGEECLKKLNGDFSFVIYNESSEEIFFARDRFGIKPFYYYFDDEKFIVSSEVKGILENKKIKKEVNMEAVSEFLLGNFAFSAGSAPTNQTFFKNIFQLEVGHCGFVSNSKIKIEKYYNFVENSNRKIINSKEKKIKEIRSELDRSIKIRIPEEVPFAVFVSGGIDSSIVAMQAKKFLKNTENNKINSYGIKYKSCVTDDNIISKKLTKKLGFNFNDKNIQIKEIIKNIDSVIKSMDSPYGSLRQNGLFMIYKRAKKDGVKVVLTGEGADEFNLGYYFSHPGFGLDLEKIKIKKNFKEKLGEKIKISSEILKNYDKEKINNKILDRYIDNYCDIENNKKVIDMVKSLYLKKFLPYRLEVNDRSSMYNSIESRAPFCDHKLAEKSFSIPLKFQVENEIEKKILRNSYKNVLPEYIINRKKTPTPESCDTELYLKIIELLEEKVSDNTKVWNEILNKENVIEIIKEVKNDILNRKNNLNQVKPSSRGLLSSKFQYRIKNIFAILTIIRWYEIYFEARKKILLENKNIEKK